MDLIFFWTPKLFEPKNFFGPKTFFSPNNFWTQTFFDPKIIFCTQNFHLDKPFFGTKFFFDSKYFQTQIFFDLKRSSLVFWYKPTQPKSLEPKTFQAEHFRPKSCCWYKIIIRSLNFPTWSRTKTEKKIPTAMMIFVQATFVLTIFVHKNF